MRLFISLFFAVIITSYCNSQTLGVALSLDYYNNPIFNSAPSPIQQRPVVFNSISISLFNIRSGFGLTEANYRIENNTPVFNDVYSGFYTLEFDIFAYPGIAISFTDSFTIGLSLGGGVRLPVIVKVDKEIEGILDLDSSINWFYSELRYLFWEGQLFALIKPPLSENTQFFLSVNYRNFTFRDNQWIIGATTGLLWHL